MINGLPEDIGVDQGLSADGWRTSSFCGPNGGNCVEVNYGPSRVIGVRDSKPSVRPVLVFVASHWASFLADARGGRFNR